MGLEGSYDFGEASDETEHHVRMSVRYVLIKYMTWKIAHVVTEIEV